MKQEVAVTADCTACSSTIG